MHCVKSNKSADWSVADLPTANHKLSAGAGKVPQAAGVSDEDADLESRLENLKRQ